MHLSFFYRLILFVCTAVLVLGVAFSAFILPETALGAPLPGLTKSTTPTLEPESFTCWTIAPPALNMDQCAGMVANFLLSLTSSVLYFAGMLFNVVLTYTVIQMGANVNGIPGVIAAWQVLRDVGNLIFIFALILIGIGTILQVGSYHWRSLLKSVIIGALLINFSITIAKVVIDISNLAATEIYNAISQNQLCTSDQILSADPAVRERCQNTGLASQFVTEMKMSSVYSIQVFKSGGTDEEMSRMWRVILIGFLGSIFILTTAFIFFAAAILFIIRYVTLIFLIIFSPIAFAGMALPQLGGAARDWWRRLFSQAFFAPAYLLMCWITLKLLETDVIQGIGEGATFAEALMGSTDSFAVIANFVIITTFMVASLIIASKMGAKGASGIQNWASNKVQGGLRSMRDGTLGFAGRNTIGRAGSVLSKRYEKSAAERELRAQELEKRGGRWNKFRAKVMRVDNKIGDRTVSGSLKKLSEKKFRGADSYAQRKKENNDRSDAIVGAARGAVHGRAIDHINSKDFQDRLRTGTLTAGDNEHVSALRRMSNAEVEKRIADGDLNGDALKAAAAHMSPQQVDHLLKSKISEADKDTLRTKYDQPVASAHNLQRARSEHGATTTKLDAARAERAAMDTTGSTATAEDRAAADKRVIEAKDAFKASEAALAEATDKMSTGNKNTGAEEMATLIASGALPENDQLTLAASMTPEQWKALMKKDLAPAIQEKFMKARFGAAISAITKPRESEEFKAAAAQVQNINEDDAKRMHASGAFTREQLAAIGSEWSESKWDAIVKDEGVSLSLKKFISENGRHRDLLAALHSGKEAPERAAEVAAAMQNMKPGTKFGEISNNDIKDIFTIGGGPNKTIAEAIRYEQLAAIDKKGRLPDDTPLRVNMRKLIEKVGDSKTKTYFNTTVGRDQWPKEEDPEEVKEKKAEEEAKKKGAEKSAGPLPGSAEDML